MAQQNPILTVKHGPNRGKRIEVEPVAKAAGGNPVFAIGTHPKADLNPNDPELAPVHALIAETPNGDYVITGRQGTVYVDGVQLFAPHRLQSGEVITVGATRLAFTHPRTPAQVAAAKRTRQRRREQTSAGTVFVWVMYLAAAGFIGLLVMYGVQFTEARQAEQQQAVQRVLGSSNSEVNVLFFYADWCGYCEQQRPTMAELDYAYGSQVHVHYINVDSSSNNGLTRQYRVSGIPHTVVLDSKGDIERQFVGYTGRQALERAIRDAYR